MSGAPSAPPASAGTTAAAAAAPTGAKSLSQNVLDLFKQLVLIPIDKTALTIVPELGHLAPFLFTMGAAFVGLVTLNPALGLLAAAGGEAYLIRNLFALLAGYVATVPSAYGPSKADSVCDSKLRTMTPARFQGLFANGLMDSFPNTPLYFLTFGAVYLIQAMLTFRQEMEALGPQYSNRPYIAILAAALLLAVYAIFLLNYRCTGLISILLTVLLGGFVGVLLSFQNYLIFGKKGVNVLFIAPLERRTGMDFVCVTTNQAS